MIDQNVSTDFGKKGQNVISMYKSTYFRYTFFEKHFNSYSYISITGIIISQPILTEPMWQTNPAQILNIEITMYIIKAI